MPVNANATETMYGTSRPMRPGKPPWLIRPPGPRLDDVTPHGPATIAVQAAALTGLRGDVAAREHTGMSGNAHGSPAPTRHEAR